MAKKGGVEDNERGFIQTLMALDSMGIVGIMQMVHDRETMMNAMYLFTLGNLKLPHEVLNIRKAVCQRLVKTITPQMVSDMFKRENLSFMVVESVFKMPLSLRKDTLELLNRML